MAHARRAAPEAPEITTFTSAPRHGGTTSIGAVLRKTLAPTAIVGLLAVTTTLTFVPVGANGTTSVADPLAAYDERVANRASREFVRAPVEVAALPAALYSPAITPAAVPTPVPTPVPSPSAEAAPVVPAPVPSVVAPTPEVVAPVATTPAVDWSVKGNDAGTRWSSASVNVRTGPGTTFDVISAVVAGSAITITDVSHDGWQQVSLKSGAGWIKSSFLSENEPVVASETSAPAPAPAPASASAAASASASAPAAQEAVSAKKAPAASSNCAKAGSAEKGMTKNTVAVLRKVCAQFSSITSYGGYRAGSGGYHGSGQAIDAMVTGEAGWEVARWVRANASSLGVVEVIYSQNIWTSQRSGDGWRSMSSRGSASANHYDHVHISVG